MEYEKRKDTLTVYLSGELDHCCAQSMRRELDALLADSCIRHLVLDMRHMSFMDSSGIGVILGRYRTLSQRGGVVSVKNMNPQVRRIFILSGMQQVIRMM